MKESIYLLRSNPSLTTNVKLVCDSSYNLYLESYSANKELSDNKYKKQQISPDSFISERLANFYKDLPSNLAFEVKNTTKSDAIQTDINLQYDDIYYSGMRIVEDTRYIEEFQYNTTLKIEPSNLPKWFFIFRADGAGITDINTLDSQSLKVIKWFDLSKATSIGKLFQKNYIDDDVIPQSPFELNLKKYEFSKWNGYDYKSGGTVSKSLFLEDYMRNSNTHYEMEKFITSQFQKNDVICSNYINISFLFDDTASGIFKPNIVYNIENDYKFMNEDIYNGDFKIGADLTLTNNTFKVNEEKSYRKRWTINRYYGFYLSDLISIKKISPTIPIPLNTNNISVFNNEFIETGTSISTIVPVMPLLSTWDDNKVYHIKIKETYYLLDRNLDSNNVYHYYIISDESFNKDFEGLLSDLIMDFDPVIKITWDSITNASYIVYQDNIPLKLDYDTKIKSSNSIFLLLKIYDKYYNVEYIDGDNSTRKCKIITDWYLTCDGNKFIRKYDSNKKEEIFTQILNKEEKIPYFEFYIPQFNQISDWDFKRDITGYANIEYDKYAYVNKNRPFLKEIDILDLSKPKDLLEETNYQIHTPNPYTTFTIFGGIITEYNYPEFYGDNFILPVASEYTATGDLYILDKQNNISDIWNINQNNCKWGSLDSISNASYPYKINNDLVNSGIYNYSPNPYTSSLDSTEFSLDWFYTIGIPHDNSVDVGGDTVVTNASILDIAFRTLNLDVYRQYQPYYFDGYTNYLDYVTFDLDYYKNYKSNFNLFNYFMTLPVTLSKISDDTIIEVMNKYYINRTSNFSKGDGYNGPSVLFKGLKAYIEYVKLNEPNLPINVDQLDKIVYVAADDLASYEFSIMFNNRETIDNTLYGKAGIEVIVNKIHKNVLIYLYVWTPFNCITNLHFRMRDEVYNEDFIYYTIIETGERVATEIKTANLKLGTLYKIFNNCATTYDGFSDGIHYSITETPELYNINDINHIGIAIDYTDNYYEPSINGFIVTIKIKEFFNLKQGDWVYLDFTPNITFPVTSKNYKIRSVLNDTITIELDNSTDALGTAPFSMPLNILPTIQKEKSLIPFRLRCIYPDEIKIDTSINNLLSDSSAPITPDNKLSSINKVLINDLTKVKDGTIENVWRNNPILRQLNKSTSDNELTFSEIEKLPSIYRYSGDYEPIINNINLFNKVELIEYGINTQIIDILVNPTYYINLFYTFYVMLNGEGKFKLMIDVIAHSTNGLLNETNIFKKGDILFLNFTSKLGPGLSRIHNFNDYNTYEKIANKYVEIEKVVRTYELDSTEILNLSLLSPPVLIPETSPGITPHLIYAIETNIEFDNIDPIYDPNFNISGYPQYRYINGNAFKVIKKNTNFDTTLSDFAMNKSIINAKYTSDIISPLKSSNTIYDEKNKFAMSDEHGVTFIDKNIFKSSWDLSYYYKTLKNKFNT